jgi:hypothetical protein
MPICSLAYSSYSTKRNSPNVENLITVHTLVRHGFLCEFRLVLFFKRYERHSATVKNVHLDDLSKLAKVSTNSLFRLLLVG